MEEKPKRIQLYVVHHEKENYPIWQNNIVTPIQAGRVNAKIKMNMIGDDTGSGNISAKDDWFSEYTVTHWIWKNCKADYIGLMHYRRAFNIGYGFPPLQGISDFCLEHGITTKNIDLLFKDCDAAVFEPMNFGNTTIFQQHKMCHPLSDDFFKTAREVINTKHKNILPTFDSHFYANNEKAYFKCCILARRQFFMDYCQFVFDILFELEKLYQSKIAALPNNGGARLYAFMGERLMSLFIAHAIKNQKRIKTLQIAFYDSLSAFNNYKTALNNQFISFLGGFQDNERHLRNLLFHERVGSTDDKRVSLNINYLGHDGNSYSALYKKDHFKIYWPSAAASHKSQTELDFINEKNEKCFAKLEAGTLKVKNPSDSSFKEAGSFVYQHWDKVLYRANFVLWNEADTNYLSLEPQQKKLFVFRRNGKSCHAVSNKLYYNDAANGRCILEKTQSKPKMDVQRIIDDPGAAPTHTTEEQVLVKNKAGNKTLKIQGNMILVNSNRTEFTEIDDWDGTPYEVALAQWYPFNVNF